MGSFKKIMELTSDIKPDVIKSFNIKDSLNTKIWKDGKLKPEIREKLLVIGKNFFKDLDLESNVKLYDITLTGSNSDNVAQKIALSSTYNSVSASTLFETQEDPSNVSLITNNASDFTVEMNTSTLYSQVESDNAFGTYTLTTSQNTSNLDHASTSVRSMLDSNGTLPDTAFTSANTSMNNTNTSVSSYFLPSSLLNHSSLAGESALTYDLSMQLTTSGDVNIASNNAGFAIKSSVKTDLVDNTAFMSALANNNSNKFANDESSITYAINNGVVGFGAAKASSVSDANNSTFSASSLTPGAIMTSTN